MISFASSDRRRGLRRGHRGPRRPARARRRSTPLTPRATRSPARLRRWPQLAAGSRRDGRRPRPDGRARRRPRSAPPARGRTASPIFADQLGASTTSPASRAPAEVADLLGADEVSLMTRQRGRPRSSSCSRPPRQPRPARAWPLASSPPPATWSPPAGSARSSRATRYGDPAELAELRSLGIGAMLMVPMALGRGRRGAHRGLPPPPAGVLARADRARPRDDAPAARRARPPRRPLTSPCMPTRTTAMPLRAKLVVAGVLLGLLTVWLADLAEPDRQRGPAERDRLRRSPSGPCGSTAPGRSASCSARPRTHGTVAGTPTARRPTTRACSSRAVRGARRDRGGPRARGARVRRSPRRPRRRRRAGCAQAVDVAHPRVVPPLRHPRRGRDRVPVAPDDGVGGAGAGRHRARGAAGWRCSSTRSASRCCRRATSRRPAATAARTTSVPTTPAGPRPAGPLAPPGERVRERALERDLRLPARRRLAGGRGSRAPPATSCARTSSGSTSCRLGPPPSEHPNELARPTPCGRSRRCRSPGSARSASSR